MKEYHLNQIIGEGATSTIYSAKLNNPLSNQEEVAIKILKNTTKTITHFEAELLTLKKVKHPNIIQLYSSHKSQRHLYIIMEKMDMSLTKFVTDNFLYVNFETPLGEEYFNERQKKVIKIIRMILLGINALHKNGIIHRDIKLGNILVNIKTIKICDFGLSTNKENNNTFCGTEDYLAPEIINRNKYDKKVDIYGIGLIMFVLLTNQKYTENLKNLENNKRLKYYNLEVNDLLKQMLLKDPIKRFSSEESLKHNLFINYWCISDSFINIEDIIYQTKLGLIKKEGNKIIFNNIELIDKNITTFYTCGCINHTPLFSLETYKLSNIIKQNIKYKIFEIEILINNEKYNYFDIPHTELKKLQFLIKFIKNMRRKLNIFKIFGYKQNYKEMILLDIFIKNTIFERKSNGDFLYLRILNFNKLKLLIIEMKYGIISLKKVSFPFLMKIEEVLEKYNELILSSSVVSLINNLEQTDISILKYYINKSDNHEYHECIKRQKFNANLLTRFSSDNTTQLINYNKRDKIDFEFKNNIWILFDENIWIFLFTDGFRIEFSFINNIINSTFSIFFKGEENIFNFDELIPLKGLIHHLRRVYDILINE